MRVELQSDDFGGKPWKGMDYMEVSKELLIIGERAKSAARRLAFASTEAKNESLLAMAKALIENQTEILEANALDVKHAVEKGLRKSLINRLRLTIDTVKEIVYISKLSNKALPEIQEKISTFMIEAKKKYHKKHENNKNS